MTPLTRLEVPAGFQALMLRHIISLKRVELATHRSPREKGLVSALTNLPSEIATIEIPAS